MDLEGALAELLDADDIGEGDGGEAHIEEGGDREVGGAERDDAAVPAERDDAVVPAVPPEDRLVRLRTGRRGLAWGHFTIIYKEFAGKYGSYEATCPYHRGTASAPRCKKTKTVAGPTQDDIDDTIMFLKA